MTHKPRNFLSKAIGSLNPFLAGFYRAIKTGRGVQLKTLALNGTAVSDDTLLPSNVDHKAAVRDVLVVQTALRNSSAWALSDDALKMIWNTDFHPELFKEHLHLPHTFMALEYEFHNEKLGLGPIPDENEQGAQRVISAWELDGYFCFSAYFRSETADTWFPSMYVITLTTAEIQELVEYWAVHKPGPGKQHRFNVGLRALIPGMNSSDEAVQLMVDANPCMDDIRIFLGLWQILRCDRPPVETIPAPEKLNKKRKKKGRTDLIPQYSTLHITPQRAFSRHGHKGFGGPRCTHWRRGHIHRWRTKKGYTSKWLPPQIINPKDKNPKIKPVVVT